MAKPSSSTSNSCSAYSRSSSVSSPASDKDTDHTIPILHRRYTSLEEDRISGPVFSGAGIDQDRFERDACLLLLPVLRGVSSGNLPVAPVGTKNPVLTHYLSQPVRRQLDWKETPNGVRIRKPLDGTFAVQAGFVQTRGETAQTPCTRCAKEKGVWKSCVVGDRVGQPRPSSEVCANCLFAKSWTCSQRTFLSSGPTCGRLVTNCKSCSGVSTRARASDASSADVSGSSTPKNRRGRSISRNTAGRRLPTPFRPRTSVAVGLTFPDLSPASIKSDTPVVEFPLSANTFNNLPFLKRALSDMESHVAKIRRRIGQLEQAEKGDNPGNPWDLL